ncbi:ClpX C4-type zinc finger protein [Candidatus Obscuribacterales bacterium]|nr:ClpX C4-type zinc finger protein [Candidatus Obscuribacterales bacterium]
MSSLKCGWCGKGAEYPLIAGLGVYICHDCVTDGLSKCTEVVSGESMSDGKCSFCNQKQSTLKKKLVDGDGFQICHHCLNTCNDIILETRAETPRKIQTSEHNEESDCDCDHEVSPLEKEWWQLRDSAKDEQELFERGKAWLKKNKTDRAAGSALASVLKIKSNATLISTALSWLEKYPNEEDAPKIIAVLMKTAPSPRVTRLASMWLKSPDDIFRFSEIISATLKSSKYQTLLKEVKELLERNPKSSHWFWLFSEPPTRERTKRVETLLVRWLQLNLKNPEAPVYITVILTRSPEVMQASFDWVRFGGKESKDAALLLTRLLESTSQYHKTLLPKVIRFARAWLKANPNDENSGQVHGALVLTAQTKTDIKNAKSWYEENKSNKSAWFVLSDLLQYAYSYSHKNDVFAVENAKVLLRDELFRHQKSRLVGSLIGAWADEESITWAKEAYDRLGLLWILARLLMRAPDSELIKEAERVYEQCAGYDFEKEILLGVLRADPQNSFFQKRARSWIKRNPKHPWTTSISLAIESARNGKRKGSSPPA